MYTIGEKDLFFFSVGWGEGKLDLQVTTGLNWPFYLSLYHVSSCFLVLPIFRHP